MGLNEWRERIVSTALRWLARLGVIAYVPSLWLSVHSDLWGVAAVDTVVYALVIALHLGRRRLSFNVRGRLLLAMFFGLGIFLIEILGPFGAGPLWLFSFSVMSAVLFGVSGALYASVLTVATLVTLGLRLGFSFLLPAGASGDHTWVWVIVAANFIFLSLVVSLCVAAILRGLEHEMRERAKAEMSLLQAQKMEALGVLASGIAHDLNNLLQPILMYAKLVQQGLPPEHSAQDDMNVILQSVTRATEMVRRILTFSRRGQVERVPTSVRSVLDETLKLISASLSSRITLLQELEAGRDMVMADPTELQQVILNLCTNAISAMRENGGVLSIELKATGPSLRLIVSDNGAGMDTSTIEHAFEPFFTTKPTGEGTGLGLAMVQRIVTAMGGSVHLTSRLGVGTNVELAFPLVAMPMAPRTSVATPAELN